MRIESRQRMPAAEAPVNSRFSATRGWTCLLSPREAAATDRTSPHRPIRPVRRPLVLDIARKNSLSRVVRCSQIMGRAETDDLAGESAWEGEQHSQGKHTAQAVRLSHAHTHTPR